MRQLFTPAHGDCALSVKINKPVAGIIKRKLQLNYGSRAPVESAINLTVAKAKYTLLIYMVGSNLESDDDMGSFNIEQMMTVGSSQTMNIVLETGGANKIGWREVMRKMVFPDHVSVLKNLGAISMGSVDTIEDFIQWGVENYPADKYMLILWDHGGGPNGGFGGSERLPAPTSTSLKGVVDAVDAAVQNTGAHFEIIGFDACLMGNAETVTGLAPYANYFIGSEDLEPGFGWQYNTFLSYMQANPTADGEAIGEVIVDGYTEQNKKSSTTLSVIQTNQVNNLSTTINAFATALNNYLDINTVAGLYDRWRRIAAIRLQAPDYVTSIWDNDSYDLVDMGQFARQLSTAGITVEITTAADALKEAIDTAVVYLKNSTNRVSSTGLTVYFPSIMAEYATDYPAKVSPFFSAFYRTLVGDYYGVYAGDSGNQLRTTIDNLAYNDPDYTATASNDHYDELYSAVGNDTCNNLYRGRTQLSPRPCIVSIQQNDTGSENISINQCAIQNKWPHIKGKLDSGLGHPALLIKEDDNLFLLPVIDEDSSSGYLSILKNDDDTYTILGFQQNAGSVNTQSKLLAIKEGDIYYVRAYAPTSFVSPGNWTTWRLLKTDVAITAPFTMTFGDIDNVDFDAFRFLIGDSTGALIITEDSVPYTTPSTPCV